MFKITKKIIYIFFCSVIITCFSSSILLAQFTGFNSFTNNSIFNTFPGNFGINSFSLPSNFGFQGVGMGYTWPFPTLGTGFTNFGGSSLFNMPGFSNFGYNTQTFNNSLYGFGFGNFGMPSVFSNFTNNPFALNNTPFGFGTPFSNFGSMFGTNFLSGFPGITPTWPLIPTRISSSNTKDDLTGKQSEFVSAGTGTDYRQGLDGYGGYAAYAPNALLSPEETTDDKDADIPREIEEADIIRIEGTDLFLLNQYRGLIICDISQPDTPSVTGRIAIPIGEPEEMYIRDNRAYIIVNGTHTDLYYKASIIEDDTLSPPQSTSRVVVVNIQNQSNPEIIGSFVIEGRVTDSRIVGNILYVVSSERPVYWWPLLTETETDDNGSSDDNHQNIYVASIDVSDPGNIQLVDREDFGGSASYIHVSEKAIFVESKNNYSSNNTTTITHVDISDPAGSILRRGSIDIPGRIEDEFKMDYYNGYFRVCTYEWQNGGVSNLFVIDTSNPDLLEQVGSVELGRGEQLFATRFDGDIGYMVTFERIDPLWVIDLSVPTSPEIKAELEVPGWSTYIETRGDHLIALGVDDTAGRKVSVSLFNVSQPNNPFLEKRVSFGDQNGWSSSVAYDDIKAINIIDEMGLILLPYTTSGYTDGRHFTDERLQLIDYFPDDLRARGWVSQKGRVLRSRSFSNRLFSVSANEIQVIDASDRDNPVVKATLTLARDIIDFTPLSNGYGVQLIRESYNNYILAAVPLSDPEDGPAISELKLNVANEFFMISNGNLVYIMSHYYNVPSETETSSYSYGYLYGNPYQGTTRVQIYDFSNVSSPDTRGSIDLPGTYDGIRPLEGGIPIYYSHYSYYTSNYIVQIAQDIFVFNKISSYYPYTYYEDATTTDGSNANGNETDNELETFKGFIVVSLSNPDNPVLASQIPFEDAIPKAFFAKDEILYFSYGRAIEKDNRDRPQSRYFLGRIDLSDPVNPLELKSINIPGVCVGLNDSGNFAYTINNKWPPTTDNNDYSQDYFFNVLKIVKNKAYLFDSVELKPGSYNVVINNGYAYLSGSGYYRPYYYGSGFALSSIAYPYYGGYNEFIIIKLTNPEKLVKYEHSLAGTSFNILGAKSFKVFATISGGTGCYNVVDPKHPELDEFKSTYSRRITFSNNKAYISLGYYGLWLKNL